MYERNMTYTEFRTENVMVKDYCTSKSFVRKVQTLSGAESERLQP
jgi:hypothetical protein